ncbi:unnamed protein product, partial [Didymodactylos carnosus]
NNLTQLCLQSTKLELIDQNDNDIYILWLTNVDEKEFESLNRINIRIFYSNDNIIDFIISNILLFWDDFPKIILIYVLINEQSNNTPAVTESQRSIRHILNNKEKLFQLIIEDIDTCTEDLICTSVFNLPNAEESTVQTKNKSFMWYYLLIESLFDLTVYNKSTTNDLVEYCRQQYSINNIEQQKSISQ